ncbi:alpha/beta hydrolase family protein [Massilia timonae]|uniref:Alpha/beta hydrolase family protein n=2 Tax=Massilia timonae TaxID=47229 RepID=A0A1S2NGH6_9BURK|nr:alpha/beta hydrolase family protein [Massilia timonae]
MFTMTQPMPDHQPFFVDLRWRDQRIQLEAQWVGAPASPAPTVVFLHEGLGSVSHWKNFPDEFCRAHGLRGLVFSRFGYGRSSERTAALTPDYLHQQAHEVLPALLAQLGIVKPWLFGHSDGASIALLYAARHSAELSGLIVAAPHLYVEDCALQAIAAARDAYRDGSLRARLAPYHADVDAAFRGWNDIWLDSAFRDWDIRADVAAITAPLMAIQGEDDPYGTLDQVYTIARLVPDTRLLVLPGCGHSPHRERSAQVIAAGGRFIFGAGTTGNLNTELS